MSEAPGERILVCLAWPYANGSLHVGHLAGVYVPADIFARFHRLRGNEVLMVSGSDEHGTPPFEYHNAPEKTRESRNRHGWSTLGDIGYVDTDGYLYLTDRKAFMIISGGVNIYPQEIENLLITHPAVMDVAVVGAPDPEMGEKVVAVVQPVNFATANAALAETLTAFARERLSHVKVPRLIEFTRELPRHPNGKLYKRLLRDAYWGRQGRIV